MVSMCVHGGKSPVSATMQLFNTSTASKLADFTFLNEEEIIISPGEIACFNVSIIDDGLDERVEDIDVLVTQGNNSNGSFSLLGKIRIYDNDQSEEHALLRMIRINH